MITTMDGRLVGVDFGLLVKSGNKEGRGVKGNQ